MANSVDITNGITKIVEITTQGPKGLKGDPGESPGLSTDIQVRNITSSGNINASGDIIANSGSFQYITSSVIDVNADTIRIGGTPFSKTDLTNLKEGKSIATSSKKGQSNFIEASSFISSVNNNVFFRTGDNGFSFTTSGGSSYPLNISGSKITLTGSLNILGNSPAITMTGDIHQAKGGYLIKDTGSLGAGDEPLLILQRNADFGIADYAESVSNYNAYNQHTYQFAPRSVISGSFGMTQGYYNSATFFSFAHGRNTSCKPPLNNVGHFPYGNTLQGDTLAQDSGVANSGLNYGLAAHSEGRNTQANVPYSHAEGYGSITTGSQAGGNHAEGYQTTAEGNYAHSEGTNTVALGLGSHTEGLGTIASGSAQHVQGKYNTHNNITSLMIIGNGASEGARSDLALFNTDGINFKTNLTASGNISGSGKLYFSSSLSASQANFNVLVQDPLTGKVYHTGSYGTGGSGEDNDWFIGDTFLTSSKMVRITASLTNGNSVSATGIYSHAEGFNNTAEGNYSHAEGRNTQAKGVSSHAEGFGAISSGSYSHAEGFNTIALGDYSHAEGNETTAAGNYSHAQGYQTRAGGQFALSQGYKTTASGDYSFAFGGDGNISEGDYSITTGTNNKAKGAHSQANGLNTQTSGSYSYTAGENTKTISSASHARAYGKDTTAKGIGSTAGGSGSIAGFYSPQIPVPPTDETHSGHYSIAHGNHVQTTKDYQAAFGQYNDTGSESTFNVGIGNNDGGVVHRNNIVDFGPTGSIKFDMGSLPNGDPGVEGQLYRTSSAHFGVQGNLQLLLISAG